jgi:DNA polymerase III epsilon subunit-like protein
MVNRSRDTWEKPPLVVGFDTETTGLVAGDDEPISYALVVYRDGQHRPDDDVELFVRSDKSVSFGSQQIHGISESFLDDEFEAGRAIKPVAAATHIAAHIARWHDEGAHFIGANPDFDFRMLSGVFQKNGIHLDSLPFEIEKLSIRDVIQRHRDVDLEDERRRSLSYLCRYYEVAAGNHDARADAHAAVQVFLAQHERMSATSAEPRIISRLRTGLHWPTSPSN